MKRMSWPDNMCFADETKTCLHGFISLEDMKVIRYWLNDEVSFIPTSHAKWTEAALAEGQEVGHYINCSTTNEGFEPLLSLIAMLDRRVIRGEPTIQRLPVADRFEKGVNNAPTPSR